VIEGADNLDFVTWSFAALVLAAPVVMAQEKKKAVRSARRNRL